MAPSFPTIADLILTGGDGSGWGGRNLWRNDNALAFQPQSIGGSSSVLAECPMMKIAAFYLLAGLSHPRGHQKALLRHELIKYLRGNLPAPSSRPARFGDYRKMGLSELTLCC